MRIATPATVTTYAFVNPIVGLTLGWAVGDDLITWRTALAAVLVIGAVLLTRETSKRATDYRLPATNRMNGARSAAAIDDAASRVA